MRGLTGKGVLVCGGSSGIGLATVRRFLQEGSRVFLVGLDPSEVAAAVADAIRAQRFYILPCFDEAVDMAEQQLRWMRMNEPLVPGPGVARTADMPADQPPGEGFLSAQGS